jgi:hypothetical protein
MIFHPGASAQAMTVAALAAPTGDIPILSRQKAIPNGLRTRKTIAAGLGSRGS